MSAPRLRGCPTCGTDIDVASAGLGLRDYRWVSPYLPDKVSPTDIDAVLERNGHFLVMEYKSPGAPLHKGQRIMLKHLVRLGMTVLIVWGDDADDESPVQVGELDARGEVGDVTTITARELGNRVAMWLKWATAHEK